LSPTRELAQQIADVLEEAGSGCGVKTACIYGGTSKGPQRSALRAGATIIIATPGRLQDLMEEGVCSLDQVSYLVLDEADRMLDLGFEPAIRAIISKTSKIRQTVMFSATWPLAVDQLAREFMNDPSPVKVMVGSQDLAANHDVTQIVEVLEDRARDARLDSLLQKYHKSRTNRVLVFVLYKKEADRVENSLQRRGWKVSAVHGDKTQADRTKAVNSFKDGTRPLLIATDVAARGLDIPDVEYVINYSFPLTTEDYVHRIGRTGRAGRKGIAHTFFTQTDRV
jgi:ATP-dependent RNA helicase DBP3